jgi:hypothetical protein
MYTPIQKQSKVHNADPALPCFTGFTGEMKQRNAYDNCKWFELMEWIAGVPA